MRFIKKELKKLFICAHNYHDFPTDKNIKSYTLNLDSEDDFITISAESDNFDSKILGTGEYEIKAGETNINISLISPSGEVSVYQILVKREASGDDTLQSIKVNGGSVKDFDPEVLEYTVNVPYNVHPMQRLLHQTCLGYKFP